MGHGATTSNHCQFEVPDADPHPVFLTGQNLAFAHDADTVAAPLTGHARTMEQGVYQVAEQFYVAVGYGNANMTMVVGTDGVILIDSLENAEAAREALPTCGGSATSQSGR